MPVEHAQRLLAAGDRQGALAELDRAAERGDSASLLELGLWFVAGRLVPRDLQQARECIRRAGDLGNATARKIYVSFVAIGVGHEPDWNAALQLLSEDATTDPEAARQLELINSMDLSSTGDPTTAIARNERSNEPPAWTVERLFTADECAYLVALARPVLRPSVIVDPITHQMRPHPVRTSEGAIFPWVSEDLVIHALNRRIAAASGTNVTSGEPLQVLCYRPGQEYRPHMDALPSVENQRVFTMLVYLNDSYEGGETLFVRTGLKFRGRVGDGLLFRNALPDGEPDEMAQHAGLPVTRGEKFIASRWIRERPLVPA
jgi:prolyl 4-hydroxylase